MRPIVQTCSIEHASTCHPAWVSPRKRSSLRWIYCVLLGLFAAGPLCRGAENEVIADKTLVAWIAPATLTQRGGSVLTIEKSQGVFDAIVFGELAPSKWMAGSNAFARTKKEQKSFPVETADSKTLVQIAIVYRGKQVTIYYDAVAKKLKIDTTKSSLTKGPKSVEAGPFQLGAAEPLRLRVFVDKSVVEVFANGRQAVMRRIYPSRKDSVGVTLFSKGGPASVTTLDVWDMMPSNPY